MLVVILLLRIVIKWAYDLRGSVGTLGLPGGAVGKEPTCQCRKCKRPGFPLEEEMATLSSSLAWRIPWIEELDKLHSMGSKES